MLFILVDTRRVDEDSVLFSINCDLCAMLVFGCSIRNCVYHKIYMRNFGCSSMANGEI